MSPRALLRNLTPPLLLETYRSIRRAVQASPDGLSFAPEGWNTVLPRTSAMLHGSPESARVERESWTAHLERVESGARGLEEHNELMTLAYVLARCALGTGVLRVLDYGASVGYGCLLARQLLPGVALEYHCRELPETVRVGRALVPDVVWHPDDSCLARRYDLVMFSNSLHYVEQWRELLVRAAAAVDRFLFLTQVPTLSRAGGYVALQRLGGMVALQYQVNREELLRALDGTGLRLVREFLIGPHEGIRGAPEQPVLRGYLFEHPRPEGEHRRA